jgi:hypothetical protein
VKKLVDLAVGTFVLLGASSSAWAAGNVAAERGNDQAVEVIIVKAKRLPPQPIDAVVTPKRPAARVDSRIPPAMPIEMPRLEFTVAEPPVVRL